MDAVKSLLSAYAKSITSYTMMKMTKETVRHFPWLREPRFVSCHVCQLTFLPFCHGGRLLVRKPPQRAGPLQMMRTPPQFKGRVSPDGESIGLKF
jgi:hypothetical protein